MNEDKTGSGAGDVPRPPPPLSSLVRLCDRQIFNVELRPGETTIVSWRKLLRDAEKAGGSTSSAPVLPSNAHPNLESRITSGKPAENEVKDAPAPHRFSAVIEKIERLYMGKHSSDEEDLNDYPDDDQYDTEDSFIDDAELDEYFEVDNSEIKHDGFFVNRGKLESISEPTVSPNQQLKKKRKKDLPKRHGENDDGGTPNRDAKLSKVAAGKTALEKNSTSSPSQSLASKNEQFKDLKFQKKLNPSEFPSKKKFTEAGISLVDSSFVNVSNGYASGSLAETKKIEKQKMVALQSKNLNNKLKHTNGHSEGLHQKYLDKCVYAQPKSHSARPLQNVDGVKEKNAICEFPDSNASKYSTHTTKTPHSHKKDGSSIKSKGSMLERAIRELERMVAESRPPMENQEADTSSQGIKRRLPTEIKLKLEKVARLAASHGKISKELINRLMSILGHLIQLRTLKRNLKVMVSMGVSAKQEKDDRFRQIKNEVTEMIRMRFPTLESKASEQQAGRSDDFQEIGSEGKEVPKRKLSIDTALEDKICDLYDLFVDGLDEDAGPQIRKLYAQLAELWPSGLMDNHGIRRAICRAKERRRALYSRHKDQEKIKKKMLASGSEEAVRAEDGNPIVQPQHVQERCADSGGHGLVSGSSKATSSSTVRMPSPSSNGPNTEKPKQDKLKDNSGTSPDDGRVTDSVVLPKKKLKRKLDNGHIRPDKLSSQHEEERRKSYKQASDLPQRSNPAPSFEHPS